MAVPHFFNRLLATWNLLDADNLDAGVVGLTLGGLAGLVDGVRA